MSKIEVGITATLADLESENRQLRASNEQLRLRGNAMARAAEKELGVIEEIDGYGATQAALALCTAIDDWEAALR